MAKAIGVFTKRQVTSSSTLAKWLRRGIFYAVLLLIWQLLANCAIWPDYL